MKPKLETEKGWTEVVIDDDCEFYKFYKVADVLQSNFNLTFTNKLNDLNTIYWDFEYKGSNLVLFYMIYEGITIFPNAFKDSTQADNECAVEIGTLLFQKLIDLNWSDFNSGKTIGAKGTESGTIINDIENSNGARITLEKECGSIAFAITLGIYGLVFHTHYENNLEKANDYIIRSKFKINKIFDLYEVPEGKRNNYWQLKYDRQISELAEITDTTGTIITEDRKPVVNSSLLKAKRRWWQRLFGS